MPVIAVPLKEAQRVLERLRRQGKLDPDRRPRRMDHVLLIPVRSAAGLAYPVVRARLLGARRRPRSLREAAAPVLSAAERAALKTAYDRVGDIAILEVDGPLAKKAKLLARMLLATHPAIKTVLKKGRHTGRYRTQHLTWLAGRNTRLTTHVESGVSLAVDVERVYFSPRLSGERLRIARLVQPGEAVLVMFSGAAPYPCIIAKHAETARVVGVEHNPVGHRLGLRNIARNKLAHIELHCGDVRRVVPALGAAFDRTVMPLPQGAETYLDVALSAARPRATLHVYQFCRDTEIARRGSALCREIRALGWAARVERAVRCGQQGPRLHRVCFDIDVQKRGSRRKS